jgi:hypothetical protein
MVLRQPGGGGTAEAADEQRLRAVVGDLLARGLSADGQVGGYSVVGSVARAAEGTRYDAVVVPVPGTGGLETIDLDVALRLHQIDIPELVLVTPRAQRPTGDAPSNMVAGRGRRRRIWRSGLIVGGVLVALLAVLAAILVHRHDPGPALWGRVGVPGSNSVPGPMSAFGARHSRSTARVLTAAAAVAMRTHPGLRATSSWLPGAGSAAAPSSTSGSAVTWRMRPRRAHRPRHMSPVPLSGVETTHPCDGRAPA